MHFPSGSLEGGDGSDGNPRLPGREAQGLGLFCHLLPFIEANNVADLIEPNLSVDRLGDDGQGNGEWSKFESGDGEFSTRFASQFKIPAFECPSDQVNAAIVLFGTRAETSSGSEKASFVSTSWADIDAISPDGFGRRNYSGVSGATKQKVLLGTKSLQWKSNANYDKRPHF